MLKRNWALIAFVYLAVAEVLSLAPVPDLSLCLVQPEPGQQSVDQNGKKYCPAFHTGVALVVEAVDAFLEHHDKSVVSAFTIVLALSTIGLWLATNKLWEAGERELKLLAETSAVQSRDMKASIAAASASAEAAQKAANVSEAALIVAERPYLVPNEPKLRMYRFGHPGMPPSDPPEWVAVLEYGFSNMGRSVAFLKEVTVELTFVDQLPDNPKFSDDGVRTLVGHFPIGVGSPYNCPNYGMNDKISGARFALINDDKLKKFFFGYVRYEDIFGYLHTEGFCFRFLQIGDGGSKNSTCGIVAGNAYNYMRREKIPPEGLIGIATQGGELSMDDIARLNKKLSEKKLGAGKS